MHDKFINVIEKAKFTQRGITLNYISFIYRNTLDMLKKIIIMKIMTGSNLL